MANGLDNKQSRRGFLKVIAAATAIVAAIPLVSACSGATSAQPPAATPAPSGQKPAATPATQAPAKAAKVTKIRIGDTLAAEHPVQTALKRWGDNLAAKTGGAFEVEVNPGGVLGTGRTGPEGVAIGTIEAFAADPSEYASFNQALNILSAPFMWDTPQQIRNTVYKPEIFDALYKQVIAKGLRCLAIDYSGTRHLTTKNVAAKTPADVKGLKIRVPEVPVYKDMVAAWGATPTPIPMADVFTALQSGTVDGQENPFAQIISSKFYEVQKYLNLTGHIVQTNSIVFNEQLYQQQPKEFQQALNDTAREAMAWYSDTLQADNDKMLQQLKDLGMTVVESDREAFRAATKPLYDQYDKNVWGADLRKMIQGTNS